MSIRARHDTQQMTQRKDRTLKERQVSAHSGSVGRIIAKATGTTWAPAVQFRPCDGGGILYDFTLRSRRTASRGEFYGR